MPPPDSENVSKACVGILYFSRALSRSGKPPMCLGLPLRRKAPLQEDTSTSASLDLTQDFKYSCVGYAAYRHCLSGVDHHSPTLPTCEGLEIVASAGGDQTRPADDAKDPSAGPNEAPKRPKPAPPGLRPTPPDTSDDLDAVFKDLPARLMRSSGRILQQMEKNGHKILDSVNRALESIAFPNIRRDDSKDK
mmetsp:Transcript_22511/g.31327  ORF Transcript_22511/g.31327 Transcript_22511/m.31327 type:complete len:192 (-) Transcript_22511:194-769(-)|eukprot:CAMPEP_0196589528 /NCGR_PEP_ID=MMETSP1081-20130531/63828_1 /TAXON_ID=36882 /ORGANISM="Pyramimonas amylifera, Strain CCMP720" /LENGTH=191 /DNA_ID=CAMNT_0041912363 /DNA_START=240 /DNA_END=815 /DNA_ORIENTATION=+